VNPRVEALVKQVEKVRWLSPEAGESELPAALRTRIEERVVAFGEALRLADPELDAPTCRIVRCAEEMCAAFLTAWGGAAEQRDSWRFQEALRRANAARWMESDDDVRDWRELLDKALEASIVRSDALRMGAPVSDPPFVRIARSELAWLAREDDVPSPWGPLLDVWMMGGWPVWLPGGEVLVYVPVRRGGAVAWVPDSPTYLELPAVAGELMTAFKMEWSDWRFRQKDALVTLPRYRVAAAGEDLLAVFDSDTIHPYVFPLRKDEVIVGRTPDNTVVLHRGNVSRHHCAILRSEGRWFVGDMNSAAGTLRNGVPVSNPELLEPGDRITLGNLTLRVLQPGEVATVAGPLVDEAAG
jgi:hypothetical protein